MERKGKMGSERPAGLAPLGRLGSELRLCPKGNEVLLKSFKLCSDLYVKKDRSASAWRLDWMQEAWRQGGDWSLSKLSSKRR